MTDGETTIAAWAVVFDFDGLIVDSETSEYEAHRQLLLQHGITLTAEAWRMQVGSVEEPINWVATLFAEGTPFDREAFRLDKRRLVHQLIQWAPMEGIRALVDDLASAGARLAVASNSTAGWVGPGLERMGLAERFAATVTRDDVTRAKPAPDIYLEAARQLGVPPARCVALEDSVHGIMAAKAAGFTAVAVPNWLTVGQDLRAADLRVGSAGALTAARLRGLIEAGSSPAIAPAIAPEIVTATRPESVPALLVSMIEPAPSGS